MLRFACPSCRSVVELADAYANMKVSCGRCGQRIQAPPLSAAKTAMATPLPAPRLPAPPPSPPPPASSAGLTATSSPKVGPIDRAQLKCPACGKKLSFRGSLAGRKIHCPNCTAQLDFSGGGVLRVVPRTAPAGKPRRSAWPCYAFGLLALLLGAGAVPAGLALSRNVVGVVLAGAGLAAGFWAAALSIFRRGRGAGLAGVGIFASGVSLITAAVLYWNPGLQVGLPAGVKPRPPDAAAPPEKVADNPSAGPTDDKPAPPPPESEPMPPPVADLAAKVESGNPPERIAAAKALRRMGKDAKAASRSLCEAAVNSNEDIASAAFDALEKVNPELYQPVLTLLRDRDEDARNEAVKRIAGMGEDGRDAVPVLCKVVSGGDQVFGDLQAASVAALVKIGHDDPEAVKAVIDTAAWSTPRLGRSGFYYQNFARPAAVAALGELSDLKGEQRKAAVDCLVKVLSEMEKPQPPAYQDEQLLLAAMSSLAKYGPDAKDARPVLKRLKLHSSSQVRTGASDALAKIGDDD